MRVLPSIVLPESLDASNEYRSLARTVVEFGRRRVGILTQTPSGTHATLWDCENGRKPLWKSFWGGEAWSHGGLSDDGRTVRLSAMLRDGRAVVVFGGVHVYYSGYDQEGIQVLDVVDGAIVARERYVHDVSTTEAMFVYATGPSSFALLRQRHTPAGVAQGRHYKVAADGRISPVGGWVDIEGAVLHNGGKCRVLATPSKLFVIGPRVWRLNAKTFALEAQSAWQVHTEEWEQYPSLDEYWGSPMFGRDGLIHFFRAKDGVPEYGILSGVIDPSTLEVTVGGAAASVPASGEWKFPADFPRAELSGPTGLGGTDFDIPTGDMRGVDGAAFLLSGYFKTRDVDFSSAAVGVFGTNGRRAAGKAPLGEPLTDSNLLFGNSYITFYTRDGYVLGHHRNRQMVAVASLRPAPRSDLRDGDRTAQGYFS